MKLKGGMFSGIIVWGSRKIAENLTIIKYYCLEVTGLVITDIIKP